MKMSQEDYNKILDTFTEHKDAVKRHYELVKSSGDYKVLEVRVAFDACRALMGTSFITGQYTKGLSDKHVRTAVVKALKTII